MLNEGFTAHTFFLKKLPKIYDSDYRVVEFKYMPDLALENARNVTIGLKGEHGQYVMVQIAFAAKWILISGIESLKKEPPPLFPETSAPSAPHLKLPFLLCSPGSNGSKS